MYDAVEAEFNRYLESLHLADIDHETAVTDIANAAWGIHEHDGAGIDECIEQEVRRYSDDALVLKQLIDDARAELELEPISRYDEYGNLICDAAQAA